MRDPAVSMSMAAGPGLAASPMRRPRQGHPCQPGRLVQIQVRRCCSKRRRVGRRQLTATLLPEASELRHPLNRCVRSRRSRLFRRGRAQAHQSTTATGRCPEALILPVQGKGSSSKHSAMVADRPGADLTIGLKIAAAIVRVFGVMRILVLASDAQ